MTSQTDMKHEYEKACVYIVFMVLSDDISQSSVLLN